MALGLLLAVSACGGGTAPDATPSTSPPASSSPSAAPSPVVVTSPDGLLSVELPPGVGDDLQVMIEQTSEPPPELADLEIRGSFYELGPDGTRFDEPVTITRTVDAEAAGFDLSQGIPTVVLASRSSDGTWEFLDDQVLEVEGSNLVVTGTTTHFSTVTAFGGAVRAVLYPPSATLGVGESFLAGAGLVIGSSVEVDLVSDPLPLYGGVIGLKRFEPPGARLPQLLDTSHQVYTEFTCAAPGKGTYGFYIDIEEDLKLSRLFEESEIAAELVKVKGPATCLEAGGSDQVTLGSAVVCVTHQEFQGHPSNLNGELGLFGPRGLLGGTLIARILGANGDQPFQVPVAKDGTATFRVGIDSFGTKQLDSFDYRAPDGTSVDLTQQVHQVLGPSVEVGPTEGVLAGQGSCPGG